MIRIFIVDDHGIVRQGIRLLASGAPDLEIVGEAADGRAVLEVLQASTDERPFDLLVLDISLPRFNGIEVLRRVHESWPDIRVVILSMFAEEQYADRLLAAGASAYVSKNHPPEELLRAIRLVMAGERYHPRSSAAIEAPSDAGHRPHKALSAREHQVFTLLFQGRTVTDIAAELDLAQSTVSNHVASIKSKLGVRTIGEIIGYAHRVGLVD